MKQNKQQKQLAPHSVEAERAVLAAMLHDKGAIDKIEQKLVRESFYFDSHRLIWLAIQTLRKKGQEVDVITVSDHLCKKKHLKEIGGNGYLSELLDIPVTMYNIDSYIEIVEEKALYRRLMIDAYEIFRKSSTEDMPIEQLIDHAGKKVYDLSKKRTKTGFIRIGEIMDKVIQEIEQHHKNKSISGITTGFKDLDIKIGGLQPASLIIVSARPGGGKTAFALNIARQTAFAGNRVGVFSLEMSINQLTMRFLSAEAKVSTFSLKRYANNKQHLDSAAERLHNVSIFIDDTFDLTLSEMKSKARILKDKQDIDLLIVDYLQLMTPSKDRHRQRYEEVGEITRGLKGLAMELGIPVIVLSQMSRAIEKRKGKDVAPMLSDLRESGSIEQDADIVLFLWEDKKKDKTGDEWDDKVSMQVIIAKQRNGPTGIVNLCFQKNYSYFGSVIKTESIEEYKSEYLDQDEDLPF